MRLIPIKEQGEFNKLFPVDQEQQCGKCKFWDKYAAVLHGFKEKASDCNAPIPDSFVGKKQWMLESEGKNCPVYEERKECEE